MFVRELRKMPAVLSPEEVARLLEAAPRPKYKAALSAAYAAGLRVSEVVSLKVSDIDSERMADRAGQGPQGSRAMLSPELLELLRDWCRIARPLRLCLASPTPVSTQDTISTSCLPTALVRPSPFVGAFERFFSETCTRIRFVDTRGSRMGPPG